MAAESSEDVYLAEKIVDSGFGQQDGKRYYKVKWVRFTWEMEETINIKLKDLMDSFWAEHGGNPVALTKDKLQPSPISFKPVKNEEDPLSSLNVPLNNAPATLTIAPSTIIPNDQTDPVTTTVGSINETDPKQPPQPEIKYIGLQKHDCEVCCRTFSSAQALKSHRKSHQPDRTFQCETCLKCFAERSTLKRHMYIHLEEKPFKCEHCDRAFSDKSTLRRHTITHTGAKRFQCPRCDKKFTRNEHLRQHMYIHTAEKLYRCEICNKDFRQRSTRKNHMLLHRAESAYKCGACGAGFSRQSLYDKHVLWCTGNTDDELKCEECDKTFQDRGALKRHQLIHSDRSVLRRHVLPHEEKKPFQCHICHKDFIRKVSLQEHMTTQHPTIQQQSPVFNLVQPVTYNLNEGITLDPPMDQHVQFVIHNPDSDVVDPSAINQIEVSSNNVLAHIPQDVLNVAATTTVVDKMQQNATQQQQQGDDNAQQPQSALRIQLPQDTTTIQPGDNQLLQVQIIRMADGNQFVQSIQAIVQGDQKDYSEHPDLVVDESHVIDINQSSPLISGGDSMISTTSPLNKDTTSNDNDSVENNTRFSSEPSNNSLVESSNSYTGENNRFSSETPDTSLVESRFTSETSNNSLVESPSTFTETNTRFTSNDSLVENSNNFTPSTFVSDEQLVPSDQHSDSDAMDNLVISTSPKS
ncbi:uncharacterized protein [Clytia hemisphaerica]|uniref:uncharacterized protein isoform X2 n=1 Tax=Clytia hemisphaerica TaxID=252671 RepID=UPI0034D492B4